MGYDGMGFRGPGAIGISWEVAGDGNGFLAFCGR